MFKIRSSWLEKIIQSSRYLGLVHHLISLIFLGTGGGRFATIYQARATGGLYLFSDSARMHIDPGPGALLRLREARIDPTNTEALVVTHCHSDHYTDAEILIEAMTHGCKRRTGILAGSRSVLNGHKGIGPAISKYHSSKPSKVVLLKPSSVLECNDVKVRALQTHHSDTTAIGLRIETEEGVISITGDTSFSSDICEAHSGCDALIMSVTRPLNARIPYHLSTEDAAELAESVKPKLAILTHFGMKLISAGPESQAKWIEKQTGVRTVSASDGMALILKNSIPEVHKSISASLADSKKPPADIDD